MKRPSLARAGEQFIRHRISSALPMSVYRGHVFYEFCDIAGDGCSGGPVIKQQSVGQETWQIISIYIALHKLCGLQTAYSDRADGFSDWRLSILDRTVREEPCVL